MNKLKSFDMWLNEAKKNKPTKKAKTKKQPKEKTAVKETEIKVGEEGKCLTCGGWIIPSPDEKKKRCKCLNTQK